MKYAKLLSLSLVLFTLVGCNKPPVASEIDNTIVEAENTPQEENSAPQIAANDRDSQVSQTKKSSPKKVAIEASTPSQPNNSDSKKVVQKVETPTQNSSSQYGTLEEVRKKIGNGRIIGSASCDGDGLENDVRVDYNGDGMPDECVTANLKIDPVVDETSLETVTNMLNYFDKGCQTTSKKLEYYSYYICKKDGQIVRAIKSENGSVSSAWYWFHNNKPVAIQRVDSNYNNGLFVYYPDGYLSSIFVTFGDEGNQSKKIKNFSNKQLQEAESLINGYKEIFNVFGVN
ncbi:MAG: hypothetical protein WBA41_33220 [Rivularia sp. (in: cyanobacteria)]